MPYNPFDEPNSPYKRKGFQLPDPATRRDAVHVNPTRTWNSSNRASIEKSKKMREYAHQQTHNAIADKLNTDHDWEKKILAATGNLYQKASMVLIDAAGNVRETVTLQNVGDINSYFGNMVGMFSSGFERTSFLTKSVRLTDKLAHLKLQNATKGLKYAGSFGIIASTTISFEQMRQKGFSNESIVRFGVDGTITIIGLFNPYGLPIGYTAALILGSMNSEGAFDNLYNLIDKTPR